MRKDFARRTALLVTMVGMFMMLPNLVQAATIRVEAYIDGKSQLTLRRDTAQWFHIDSDAPGRWSGNNYPTVINSFNWFPLWPSPGGNSACNCNSNITSGVNPAISATAQTVTLNPVQVRNNASIIQQPDAGNDYSLIVEFDDPDGGADWYIVELDVPFTYVVATAVPTMTEWGMILLGILLGGSSICFIRKRKSVQG